MRYCIECGSECPDEAAYCWKCGRQLYAGEPQAPTEPTPPESEAAPPQPAAAVTVREPKDDDGWVTLEKTPERITNRRAAIILGLITAVAIICLMAVWEYNMLESGGFYPDRESESILEIAEMSGYGILIYLFLVLAVIFAITAIVTPRIVQFGALFLLIAGLISAVPFDVTHWFSTTHYELNGLGQIAIFVVLCVVIFIIGFLADVMFCKSLNKDGKTMDRDTDTRNHGLLYNIDADWNVVRRKG